MGGILIRIGNGYNSNIKEAKVAISTVQYCTSEA